MRGALGADPDIRAIVEELRWNGAQKILHHLGVTDPIPPALRTTMRGWVGYLDEIILDRLEHHDIDTPTLVELATANLITALRTAIHLHPPTRINPTTLTLIETLYHGCCYKQNN